MFFYGITICLAVTGLAVVARSMLSHPAPPPVPTVADLKFPVAVIFDESDCRIHHDAADLHVMGLMRVMAYKDWPYLVDNELNLFQLENLISEKNSWQIFLSMGNGSTPVSFTLKTVRDDSHAHARGILTGCIPSHVSDDESAVIRDRIQSARTLSETLSPDWRR